MTTTITAARKSKLGRGLAVNNPLNLFWNDRNKWVGQDVKHRDGRLEAFLTFQAGVRAAAKVMLKYRADGFTTIDKIITKWAPPVENDTASYIATVARRVGIPPGQEIDVDNCKIMLPLVKAMGRVEQGIELPYSDDVILEGLRAAGIHDVAPPPVIKTPEGKSGVVQIITAGAGAAVTLNQQFQDTLMNHPYIGDISRYMIGNQPKLVGVLVVIALIAAGYALWARRKKQALGLG